MGIFICPKLFGKHHCFLAAALLLLPQIAQGQDVTPAQVKALPECSLAKTNANCKIIIDRSNPIAPPAVQMYSDQVLTVVVKHPKDYEKYFLDYQSGQGTLTPDVASAVVAGLLPSLGKLGEFTALIQGIEGAAPPPDPCSAKEIQTLPQIKQVASVIPAFQLCLGSLSIQAIDIYREMEPSLAPDSRSVDSNPEDADVNEIGSEISHFLKQEFAVSSRISAITGDATLKGSPDDAPALLHLTNLQKLVDSTASDLMGYQRRIADLSDFDNGAQNCARVIELTKQEIAANIPIACVYLTSRRDDHRVYRNMVTRTVTYSINTLNLIANSQQAGLDPSKKKALAPVSINFADRPTKVLGNLFSPFRWEGSAGAFFSMLPIRSFAVSPVFSSGAVTDKKITQNVLHPTVVPFAAANYRLTDDLKWTRWRSSLYWTSAIGINPNTVSADFATGLSISWRALLFSGLCHFGHDVRLTQGLKAGQSLGTGFSGSLPTETYWTPSFAFGVSVRVPALAGR